MNNRAFNFFVILGRIGIVLVPLLILGFIALFWIKSNFQSAVNKKLTEKVKFIIEENSTITQIAKNLEDKKLINSAYAFKWLAEEEKSKKITAGEYLLSASQTPKEVMNSLFSGKTINYVLKIKPCETIAQISKSIGAANILDEKEALEAFKNPRLMTELGIPAYIPEGYLIEGSYEFSKPASAKDFISQLVKKTQDQINKKIPDWIKRADELGYRPYEILVLSSIIEKEARSNSTELASVSSVYHNRLKIGMQLQSPQTLRYAIPTLLEPMSENDMLEETPYNTFINIGLPPTPICSASVASIYAALNPAETESLYFLKKKDGSFDYSNSFKAHQGKLKAQK